MGTAVSVHAYRRHTYIDGQADRQINRQTDTLARKYIARYKLRRVFMNIDIGIDIFLSSGLSYFFPLEGNLSPE